MFSRFILAIGLAFAFLGWIAYRLFIKKDLKKHWNEVLFGFFFFGFWAFLYWLLVVRA